MNELTIKTHMNFIEPATLLSLNEQSIYWLLDDKSRIVYVGRTGHVPSRIAQHRRDKTFDTFLEFPVPAEHVNYIEAALIKLLRPRLNQSIEACSDDLHYLRIFFQMHFTTNPQPIHPQTNDRRYG